eukprot:CFRG7520T1
MRSFTTTRICIAAAFLVLSISQLTHAQTPLTLCLLSDDEGSEYYLIDTLCKYGTDFYQEKLQDGTAEPWTVEDVNFNVTFRYIDTGHLATGNGVATYLGGTSAAINEELNLMRSQEAFLKILNENDPTCDLWFTQFSSTLVKFSREMMLDKSVRTATTARIRESDPSFALSTEIITKPIMGIGGSDFSLYDEILYPNFYGSSPRSVDVVGDFMDAMYAKGARTVAILTESDTLLDDVYSRAVTQYLAGTTNEWKQLYDPGENSGLSKLISLVPQSDPELPEFLPDQAIYARIVDHIYNTLYSYNKATGNSNNIPDLVILSTSTQGSTLDTLSILAQEGLGADAFLILNEVEIEAEQIRNSGLYPGLAINQAYDYDAPISPDAISGFLGPLEKVNEAFRTFITPRLGAPTDLSTVPALSMISIQTFQMAMARANCKVTGAALSECVQHGIMSPCSSITSVTNQDTCNALGAEHMDVETWFGRVHYTGNQLEKPYTYRLIGTADEVETVNGVETVVKAGQVTNITPLEDVPLIIPDGFPQRILTEPSLGLKIFIGIACALGIVGCIGGIIGVQCTSHVLVVRSAAPLFLQIMLFGATLMYTSLFFILFDLEDWMCIAWSWFLFFGWAVAFIALLVKTYRVDQVFKSVTKTKLHDNRLLRNWFLPVASVFVVYLIVVTILDPPTIEIISSNGTNGSSEVWEQCQIKTISIYIGLGLQCIVLIWAAILAFKVRNAPSSFNEATLITMSVYNWLVIECVTVALFFILPNEVDTPLILLFVYTYLPLTIMMLMMFVPKVYAMYNGKGNQVSTQNTSRAASRVPSAAAQGVANASMSEKSIGGGMAQHEVRKLRAEVGRLVNENTRLTDVLQVMSNPHVAGGGSVTLSQFRDTRHKSVGISIHDVPTVSTKGTLPHIPTEKDEDSDDEEEGFKSVDTMDV